MQQRPPLEREEWARISGFMAGRRKAIPFCSVRPFTWPQLLSVLQLFEWEIIFSLPLYPLYISDTVFHIAPIPYERMMSFHDVRNQLWSKKNRNGPRNFFMGTVRLQMSALLDVCVSAAGFSFTRITNNSFPPLLQYQSFTFHIVKFQQCTPDVEVSALGEWISIDIQLYFCWISSKSALANWRCWLHENHWTL